MVSSYEKGKAVVTLPFLLRTPSALIAGIRDISLRRVEEDQRFSSATDSMKQSSRQRHSSWSHSSSFAVP